MMKRSIVAGALSLSIAFSACATPEKGTAIGAGVGTAGGAAVGGVVGGAKGAMIGASVGLLTGAALGNYLDKRKQELSKVADTEKTDRGLLVKLRSDVLFPTGSATVQPESRQQLTELAKILAKYPGDKIVVKGHTDSKGTEQFNFTLSENRAESVEAILLTQGLPPAQVKAVGVGEGEPIAPNTTEQGRSKNRRVEIVITPAASGPQGTQTKKG